MFDVTLTATLTKDWTVKRVVQGECVETTTATGHWKLSLRSRRSSRLAFTAPAGRSRALRLSPAVVRAISGTATQGGRLRTDTGGPRCVRSTRTINCAVKRASFRNASARLTTPRAGTARFARIQGAGPSRSLRSSCPEEPSDVRAARTELELAEAPLSTPDVFDRGVPLFFITGDSEQVTTIEGDYDGRVTERVRWKLTFKRLRG